jgi:hypothetical protein
MIKVVHDIAQDTYTEIELSSEELAQREAIRTQYEAEKTARESEEIARNAARQAVLDKLGLTAEEIAALLS